MLLTVSIQVKRGVDLDTGRDGFGDRAVLGVHVMHALDDLPVVGISIEVIGDVDLLDDQNVLLILTDYTANVRREIGVHGRDVARFQRAGEGSGQSTRRRSDDVVNRRVPCAEFVGIHAVMLRDGSMHTKLDRFVPDRHMSKPVGSFLVFDPYVRNVIG